MATGDVLLDTRAFLWAITDDPRLSDRARDVFLDERNRLLLSVASISRAAGAGRAGGRHHLPMASRSRDTCCRNSASGRATTLL